MIFKLNLMYYYRGLFSQYFFLSREGGGGPLEITFLSQTTIVLRRFKGGPDLGPIMPKDESFCSQVSACAITSNKLFALEN